MGAESERYARITQRLASAMSSEDDEASQALVEVLQRRIVDTIAAECAPQVTADVLSQRLSQAIAALGEYGIVLRLTDAGLKVDACFCASHGCAHAQALLQRLLGAAVQPITTQDGATVLRVLGVVDAASYT